jgi:iron complex outermembrane receptor protein
MFEVKPMAVSVAKAFGGVAIAAAFALPAGAQQAAQQLERVEITGSNIKRVDTETPQPLIIINRDEIERSGKTTLNELLVNLPIVSSGSFSEATGAGNSFAPGTAAVSIRGLGVNTVLVLLNGRRVAGYGFAQNINEAFVDLNSIPLTAIERIDILKDGASAIYGSDAIAGVINVILRKDFRGVEVTGRYGSTKDGGATEYSASVATGFGNLASDRYNVMATLDYYHRDALKSGQRSYSKTANQEPRGGFDFRSPTGNPGTWVGAATGAPTGYLPFANCPADRNTDAILGVPTCAYDFASDNWLLPKTERLGAFARGVFDFTSNLSAFAELGYTKNVTNQSAAPTPGSFPIPAANPSNPFGANVSALFRMTEVGPRLNEIETENTRMVLGLRGSTAGFDWEGGLNWSKNDVTNTGTNYIDQRSANAVMSGTLTGFTGQFWNLTGPNNPALVNALRVTPVRTGESELKSVDLKGSRELFSLPGGSAAIAMGLEYREESIADTPDPLSRLGVIVGSGGTSTKGERDLAVGYIELSMPFIKGLETQFALRHDKYSDFGGATTGKVSLGYRPTSNMLIRGGGATGFRAPSLVELYLGQSISFPQVRDVPRCNAYRAAFGAGDSRSIGVCGTPQVRTEFLGNARLDAEKSRSYSLGVVFEPVKDLSLALDYWSIYHENRITSPTAGFIIANPALYPTSVNRAAQNANDILAGAPGALRGTASDTAIGISRSFFNSTFQKTWGYDFDARYSWTMADIGRFRVSSAFTYLGSFKAQANPGQPATEYVSTFQYPRWRNVTQINWRTGSWDSTLGMNYMSSYDQFYFASVETVKSFTTFDLQTTYSVNKKLGLTVGANNVFNTKPPFADNDWFGYDADSHNPKGAFYYGRVTYKF